MTPPGEAHKAAQRAHADEITAAKAAIEGRIRLSQIGVVRNATGRPAGRLPGPRLRPPQDGAVQPEGR